MTFSMASTVSARTLNFGVRQRGAQYAGNDNVFRLLAQVSHFQHHFTHHAAHFPVQLVVFGFISHLVLLALYYYQSIHY